MPTTLAPGETGAAARDARRFCLRRAFAETGRRAATGLRPFCCERRGRDERESRGEGDSGGEVGRGSCVEAEGGGGVDWNDACRL